MTTYSQSYHYAVGDARSQEAKEALADLPGEVGRLVRKLAAYNAHKRDEARSDALSTLVFGAVVPAMLPDLPWFGTPPDAWSTAYEPYRAAYSELQACDDAFRALWARVCDKLLSDVSDDEAAAALVARIQAVQRAIIEAPAALSPLRVGLLPDALSSWLTAIQHDQAKLPTLAKAREAAEAKAQQARQAEQGVVSHLDYAKGQMQAIGKEMLSLVEHADKHEQLRKLLPDTMPQPIGRVLYPRGQVQPLAKPEEAGSVDYAESPW
jgi:hypothetical protein